MRLAFIGLDNRPRVAEIHRIKFLDDGFLDTDNRNEYMDTFHGPAVVVHIYLHKGGRRLIFKAPERMNMEAARMKILQDGWLDLSDCELVIENRY